MLKKCNIKIILVYHFVMCSNKDGDKMYNIVSILPILMYWLKSIKYEIKRITEDTILIKLMPPYNVVKWPNMQCNAQFKILNWSLMQDLTLKLIHKSKLILMYNLNFEFRKPTKVENCWYEKIMMAQMDTFQSCISLTSGDFVMSPLPLLQYRAYLTNNSPAT